MFGLQQQQQQQQNIQNSFGHDYTQFSLGRYVYGTIPGVFVWSEFFEWSRIKREIYHISHRLVQHGLQVQPPMINIFKAFVRVNTLNMRVVILGQDPTPTAGRATGMAFSFESNYDVRDTSTGNILKLLQKHRHIPNNYFNGDLTKWTERGVFLLNSALTITVDSPQSAEGHQNLWRKFTKLLISYISIDARHSLVWMLWGNKARSFKRFIDEERHIVLEGVHPSPTFQNGEVFLNGPDFFKQANQFFQNINQPTINWNLAA